MLHKLKVFVLASGALYAVLSGTAYVASTCQCKYTPVLFAERAGLTRLALDVEVPVTERGRFARGLQDIGVLVDPDWKRAPADTKPAVYVDATRLPRAQAYAASWMQAR